MKDNEENPCCYFHPKEVVVGVCALCLNERLLILASKQGKLGLAKDTKRTQSVIHRKSPINLPKIFALSSFLNRLELRHQKSNHSDSNTSTSQEDSFISIKFENNGVASWDRGVNSKLSLGTCNIVSLNQNLKEAREPKSVVEHVKPHGPLRWRKRIGQIFRLIRWKRSSKANVYHKGGKVEGVKVRMGWMRTLTKRRTMA